MNTMPVDSRIRKEEVNGNADKVPLQKCSCRENLLFLEGNEIVLKCRIVKIVDGVVWAKCRRCGQWVIMPLTLSKSKFEIPAS